MDSTESQRLSMGGNHLMLAIVALGNWLTFVILAAVSAHSDRGYWRATFDYFINRSDTFDYKLKWFVPVPLICSFLYHGYMMSSTWGSKPGQLALYSEGSAGNWLRWLDHAFGGAILFWVIASVAGVTNVMTLVLLSLMVVFYNTGHLVRERIGESDAKILWVVGWILWVAKWVVVWIAYGFFVNESPHGFADGAWALVPVSFFLSLSVHLSLHVPDALPLIVTGVFSFERILIHLEIVRRIVVLWLFWIYFYKNETELAAFS